MMPYSRLLSLASLSGTLLTPVGCARAQHLSEIAPQQQGARAVQSAPVPQVPQLPQAVSDTSPVAASADSSSGATLEVTETTTRFRSRTDSLAWVAAKGRAEKARGYRVVVSLIERRLWVMSGADTLREAPVAVAKGTTLAFAGKSWTFRTPRGVRTVLRKDSLPVWTPPEWHYAEVASEHSLKLARLPLKKGLRLRDGSLLTVRDSLVGVVGPDSVFAPLPTDEEIVFDSTLFVPPVGTRNRQIEGELGRYKLELGDGYLLHGTPHESSIGRAATHGCIRLRDEDITWLYDNIPIGTRVYIY